MCSIDFSTFLPLLLLICLLAIVADTKLSRMQHCPQWRRAILRILNFNAFFPGVLAAIAISARKDPQILNLCSLIVKISGTIVFNSVPIWYIFHTKNLLLIIEDQEPDKKWYRVLFLGLSKNILITTGSLVSAWISNIVFPENSVESTLELKSFIFSFSMCIAGSLHGFWSVLKIFLKKCPTIVKWSSFFSVLFTFIRIILYLFLKKSGIISASEGFEVMYGLCCIRLIHYLIVSYLEKWDLPQTQFSRADLKTVYQDDDAWQKFKEQASKDCTMPCMEFIEDYNFIKNKGYLPGHPNFKQRCLSEADLYGTYIEKGAKSRLPLKKEFLDFIENEFKHKTLCLADFDTIYEQCLIILYEKSFPKYWQKASPAV